MKAISIRTPRSPLTISRTQPASRLGGVTRTILGGAATVAGTYAIQRMSERRQTTAGPATSRLPKRFTRLTSDRTQGITGRVQWDKPIGQRSRLSLDKGAVSTMLASADRLFTDSPAAAIALMDIVAQRGELSHFGRARLTTFLQTAYPHRAAILSGQVALRDAEQTQEGQLTSKLSQFEITFLGLVHGTTRMSPRQADQYTRELESIATELEARGHTGRQVSARIILANIALRRGDLHQANDQLSRALGLMGTLYDTQELSDTAAHMRDHQAIQPAASDKSAAAPLPQLRG